ncbi:SDR family oxidoreductase [Glycomyces buryatensis]|uniref:SDR family oxidoreductase n=1 Tax=Glycomyces buryatensis TaxID=2570927 RepID=A0A4S8QB65_9ACTN|nr:SDR family oxidoreductase [Glycomyces buryatensis]THV40132.1 SDR family oxidoreductase [Glycomyces buryatensis]
MIVVTGATGHLGQHVVAGLLETVPADQLAVVVRDAAKAADLAERGVDVRVADYSRPETLKGVFGSGDKVLLISGSEVGQRLPQHTAVIDAAKEAGVGLLAYTSVLGGPAAEFQLAEEHIATERYLIDSGLPYALLRNGWYHENYTENLGPVLAAGGVLTSVGEGRVASASRPDFAAAAVAVLTGEGHENQVYELSGDTAWNFEEYAAEVSRQAGRELPVNRVPAETYLEILVGSGLPEAFAGILVDVDGGIERGLLATRTGDLARLIGRPTTPIADAIAAGLKAA